MREGGQREVPRKRVEGNLRRVLHGHLEVHEVGHKLQYPIAQNPAGKPKEKHNFNFSPLLPPSLLPDVLHDIEMDLPFEVVAGLAVVVQEGLDVLLLLLRGELVGEGFQRRRGPVVLVKPRSKEQEKTSVLCY